MSTVKQLHDEAMMLLQDAIILRDNGDDDAAEKAYEKSYILESNAAELVSQKTNCEPTRSILFRSAASLAYQAGDYDNSLNLIGKCLSGNPTVRIKNEIRELYENIYFKLYLNQKRIVLTDEEIDFHLVGNQISNGLIFYKEFIDRINGLIQIIKKTTLRMFNKPYRSTSEIFSPILHPVRGGSFSITIKIAYNKYQQQDIFVNPAGVIDEIIDCFGFIQNEKEDELFAKINDETFYNNFVSNTKKIAPDGKNITSIDFITKRKDLKFLRTSDSIPLLLKKDDEVLQDKTLEKITISGILDLASSKQGKNEFAEITDEKGNAYKIIIKEGLDDYVRSYYKTKVIVEGKFDGNSLIYLENMKNCNES